MIDRRHLGHRFPPASVEIEKSQLRLFAKATRQVNPVYFEEDAAREAGYRSILAPPTFGFSLLLAVTDPFPIIPLMGIDQRRCLHGEQLFLFSALMFAGDRITLESEVTGIYEKEMARLDIVEVTTECANQLGEKVLRMITTTVITRP